MTGYFGSASRAVHDAQVPQRDAGGYGWGDLVLDLKKRNMLSILAAVERVVSAEASKRYAAVKCRGTGATRRRTNARIAAQFDMAAKVHYFRTTCSSLSPEAAIMSHPHAAALQ